MLAHVLLAIALQLPLSWLLRSWAAGTGAACAWSISREITQAEYRWIERYGEGLRANMPWWGGLDPRVWHLDAWLDWLVPCVAVMVLAALASRSGRLLRGADAR